MSVAIPINCKFVRKIMINHRIFGCHLCNCAHVSLPRPELKPCDSKLEMTRFSKAHALCPKKVLGSEGVHDIRPLDNQIKLGRHENFMIRTNFVRFKHVQPRRQPIQFSRIMCINSHVVQIGFIVSLHSQCTCHRRKQPSNNDPQTTRLCELQTHELVNLLFPVRI